MNLKSIVTNGFISIKSLIHYNMSARADKTAHLSDIDKKLLKILLSPNGNDISTDG